MTTEILSSILVMSRHLDTDNLGGIVTTNTATKMTPLWIALLALFTFRAATTGGFHQPSTYVGIAVGTALVGGAWAIGRYRAAKSAR